MTTGVAGPYDDFYTVEEAAQALKVSETEVCNRQMRRELNSVTTNGTLYIILPKSLRGSGRIDRRALLGATGAIAGGLFWAGIDGWGTFIYDKCASWMEQAFPSVRAKDVFPEWGRFNLAPGMVHPDYGFHPDVQECCSKLSACIAKSNVTSGKLPRILSESELPPIDVQTHLCIFGSPVASDLSRQWRGFHYGEGGVLHRPEGNPHSLRWDFYYERPEAHVMLPHRYVSGKLIQSWPKYIIDHSFPQRTRCAEIQANDGRLESDYLLITYLPNVLAQTSGKALLDVADLHGQGEKSFPLLLQDGQQLAELHEEVRRIRAEYFQALYQIPVLHSDERCESKPGTPRLIDVFKLG